MNEKNFVKTNSNFYFLFLFQAKVIEFKSNKTNSETSSTTPIFTILEKRPSQGSYSLINNESLPEVDEDGFELL